MVCRKSCFDWEELQRWGCMPHNFEKKVQSRVWCTLVHLQAIYGWRFMLRQQGWETGPYANRLNSQELILQSMLKLLSRLLNAVWFIFGQTWALSGFR